MSLKLLWEIHSPLQYRDLFCNGGRLFVAGGRDGMTGPRSTYSAAVACFGLQSGELIWETIIPKSYPFRQLTANDRHVAATLPFNFQREPCGLFVFNAADGTRLDNSHDHTQHVTLRPNGHLLAGGTHQGATMVRLIDLTDLSVLQEQRFPAADARGNSLDAMGLAGVDSFLVTFAGETETGKAGYAHEVWRLGETRPQRSIEERKRRTCLPAQDCLVTGDTTSLNGELALYEQRDGKLIGAIKPKLGQLWSFCCREKQQVLACFVSGVVACVDIERQIVHELGLLNSLPDWRRIAVTDNGRILVMDTGNFQDPHTDIFLFDVSSA